MMVEGLIIDRADPCSAEAEALIKELSDTLLALTGHSGCASFRSQDVTGDRACFLVAHLQGEAVGCGGFRPMDERTAEIKRVYVRQAGQGIGQQLFHRLTDTARSTGYRRVVLETRRINTRAMRFYHQLGCREIANYGDYAGRSDCVCFEYLLDK